MSEQVIRHRGGGRDENSELTEPVDTPLTAMEIAPGGGSKYAERSREGESIAYTVYFMPGVDLTNSDELTVRNQRFSIIVNDWRSAGRGGLEVLCTRSQG